MDEIGRRYLGAAAWKRPRSCARRRPAARAACG